MWVWVFMCLCVDIHLDTYMCTHVYAELTGYFLVRDLRPETLNLRGGNEKMGIGNWKIWEEEERSGVRLCICVFIW